MDTFIESLNKKQSVLKSNLSITHVTFAWKYTMRELIETSISVLCPFNHPTLFISLDTWGLRIEQKCYYHVKELLKRFGRCGWDDILSKEIYLP